MSTLGSGTPGPVTGSTPTGTTSTTPTSTTSTTPTSTTSTTATSTTSTTSTSTTTTTTPPTGCPAAWSSTAIYVGGDQATYGGHTWKAKWWTQGDTPSSVDPYGPWEDQGTC